MEIVNGAQAPRIHVLQGRTWLREGRLRCGDNTRPRNKAPDSAARPQVGFPSGICFFQIAGAWEQGTDGDVSRSSRGCWPGKCRGDSLPEKGALQKTMP